MKFKLDSKIEVRVDAFLFEQTYAGVYIYPPFSPLRTAYNIVRLARIKVPKNWSNRAFYIKLPDNESINDTLPLITYYAWLDSDWKTDKKIPYWCSFAMSAKFILVFAIPGLQNLSLIPPLTPSAAGHLQGRLQKGLRLNYYQ